MLFRRTKEGDLGKMDTFPPFGSISGPQTYMPEQPEPSPHRVAHVQGEGEASKSLGKVVTFYFTHDTKKGMKERTFYL